jgi:hypothetical protein
MEINFEPDWDYMLEKAANFYSRNPYVNYNTGYTYADYSDKSIETFLGTGETIFGSLGKDGKKTEIWKGTAMGLKKAIVTRFEWRWEHTGPKYFPRGANTCIEWNLTNKKGYIVDLTKNNKVSVVQPEEIWFCMYGEEKYENVIDFWARTWNLPRTLDD